MVKRLKNLQKTLITWKFNLKAIHELLMQIIMRKIIMESNRIIKGLLHLLLYHWRTNSLHINPISQDIHISLKTCTLTVHKNILITQLS